MGSKKIPCPVCGGMGCGRCDEKGFITAQITNLDWIKDPNTTAEQVVDFIRSLCTEAAKDQWCDAFDGDCRACMAAYLLAEKKES